MKTYEEYKSDEVVFVSLTEQGSEELVTIDEWVTSLEIPWSVGYGAGDTLQQLEVPGFPTTFVIDPDGNVAWHSFLGGSLDKAIRKALP